MDGVGGFGLDFPADGVVNHLNPTPCQESDSVDYNYIKGVFEFIASHDSLDESKVYLEGFSQSSMYAAYISVCFADRVAGVWQGGSGLALTFHAPVVPGNSAQCSLSDYFEFGEECCRGKKPCVKKLDYFQYHLQSLILYVFVQRKILY